MTDFIALADDIASQLDGVRKVDSEGADGAPAGRDIAWIDLANERTGLRVVLRRGDGAEFSRVRATMSYTGELRGDLNYREMPAFHELTTAAALSRGGRIIAAQIESKIIAPALPMLEAWKIKRAAIDAEGERMVATMDRWRKAFPRADIKLERGDKTRASFRLSGGGTDDYWFVNGDLTADGSIYIQHMSRLPEAAALALFQEMASDRK